MRALASGLMLAVLFTLGATESLVGADYTLADGKAWPGRLVAAHPDRWETLFIRPSVHSEFIVPRLQSITQLGDGTIVFCSGLDRAVYALSARGEEQLHYGGGLVRQVRTSADGTLYWSGLETPLDGNPLPDGFIYAWDPTTRATRVVQTFSQGDVGRDWWGAFDVHAGRIIVGTLRGQTSLYDISASPVVRIATLPLAATAFRFAADDSLLAADGAGKLYRFPDLNDVGNREIVYQGTIPFTDFSVQGNPATP